MELEAESRMEERRQSINQMQNVKTALLLESFEIASTASFILRRGFERVCLQFPDELLQYSVAVTTALEKEILKQRESSPQEQESSGAVRLFVLADTQFGSCCSDEIAAMHVDGQCIVHYGHACLSQTSRVPVWFVFRKDFIDPEKCATRIVEFAADKKQPVLVMCGLNYVYALEKIQEEVSLIKGKGLDITFVTAPPQLIEPAVKPTSKEDKIANCRTGGCTQSGNIDVAGGRCKDNDAEICCNDRKGESIKEATGVIAHESDREGSQFTIGGLKWVIPPDRSMEDYIILWIGGDDPGLTSMALTFNSFTIVRYDCHADEIVTDVAKRSQLLSRRYYLVERAKDANLVGIVAGTLGVAGYLETIQRLRRMVKAAGKKAYTLVMGKPNPAKLANFPECEVFVFVSCPQTALLDSKEYLAPVITPFEAELAFIEGKQWKGEYRLDLPAAQSSDSDAELAKGSSNAEPRFSFLKGSYIAKASSQDADVQEASSTAMVSGGSECAMQWQSDSSLSIANTERSVLDIKSGAEYLASRSYQGLDLNQEGPEGPRKGSKAVVGRTGRAAGYTDEIAK